MLDQFLEGSNYYDYPSFEVALYSLFLALILSTTIALTYKFTYSGVSFSNSFFQAMILSSLVTAMIMMAVANNIAVGFGIMGAVAIIRFRTNIQNPRNIVFIFSTLSIGIATGVHGYAVAIAGTLLFCVGSFLLSFYRHVPNTTLKYQINFQINNSLVLAQCEAQMKHFGVEYEMGDIKFGREQLDKYAYAIELGAETNPLQFFEALKAVEGVSDLNVIKKKFSEQL